MHREWFKLEVLQDYSGEDAGESLGAWLKGDRRLSMQLLDAESTEWAEKCQEKISLGAKLIRIHVVDYPLSDYMQWEIEVYRRRNVRLGGEEVYLLDRRDIPDVDLPTGDMMMFDENRVVVGHYSPGGRVESQDFYDAGDDISGFLSIRARLLEAPRERIV